MASLSEREARLIIATATEPGDSKVIQAVAAHGALECLAQPRLLPDVVADRLTHSSLEQLQKYDDCRWLVPGDLQWPAELSILRDTEPLGIWMRGASAELHKLAVSVVGARSSSQYGEYAASEIAAGVCEAGLAVVSGGAYGIDAAAHRGALAVGGTTIAILAGGVDVPYPRSNHALFDRMLDQGGLLVSETPLGVQPLRHRFLSRNRLIAAWGQAVVVVEARLRSGAIATASHAGAIGRDVLAVPGPITSAASAGCHQLIRDGAVLVTSAEEVLELIQN